MATLDRYILRALLGPFAFFLLVLTGVVWLAQALRVIDIVINHGKGARVFMEFTLLLLPTALTIVVPICGLIATAWTFNRLLVESELIAGFGLGLSRMRALRGVFAFGLLLMLLTATMSLWAMPMANREMRDRVALLRADITAGLLKEGQFLNPAKGLTVFISSIERDGTLNGLLVHDARDRNRPITYTAERGLITHDQSPRLLMFNGMAQRIEALGTAQESLSTLSFEQLAFDLSAFMGSTDNRVRKHNEWFFWELLNPTPEMAPTKRLRGRLIAEGHEQLTAPLYALVLPLVVAALILSSGFSRRGIGEALIVAIGCAALVRVLGLAAKVVTTATPSLGFTMYLLPLTALGVALWRLWRADHRLSRPSAGVTA